MPRYNSHSKKFYPTNDQFNGIKPFMSKSRRGDELHVEVAKHMEILDRNPVIAKWIEQDIIVSWISPHSSVGLEMIKHKVPGTLWINLDWGTPTPTPAEARFMASLKGFT